VKWISGDKWTLLLVTNGEEMDQTENLRRRQGGSVKMPTLQRWHGIIAMELGGSLTMLD
jgi:hypothetical protein